MRKNQSLAPVVEESPAELRRHTFVHDRDSFSRSDKRTSASVSGIGLPGEHKRASTSVANTTPSSARNSQSKSAASNRPSAELSDPPQPGRRSHANTFG